MARELRAAERSRGARDGANRRAQDARGEDANERHKQKGRDDRNGPRCAGQLRQVALVSRELYCQRISEEDSHTVTSIRAKAVHTPRHIILYYNILLLRVEKRIFSW